MDNTRKRQRPAERPTTSDVLEIRERARRQFPTNDVILAARATARLSAQDKADRRGGRSQAPERTSLRRRWGAFLLQTARSGLTPAQARSVRRRSTRDELLALDDWERTMLGVRL
jgi:hypothetical protein